MSSIEQNKKLYKCYKETCNRCINDELITDYEYQELLDAEGKIVCPEDHDECGIKEIPEAEYPSAPKSKPPIAKFAIIGGVVLAIIIVVIFVFSGDNDKATKKDVTVEDIKTEQNIEETTLDNTDEPVVGNISEPVTEAEITEAKAPKGTQTLKFKGGSKYTGEIKNGKMHGLGTYYYGRRERISTKDLKKRMAEKGDYITGEFYNGKLVSGKLYDRNNNMKEIIMVGR